MSRMTWTAYQEQHNDLANDPEELKKKMPTHHILRYPEEEEHPPFLEVCLACSPKKRDRDMHEHPATNLPHPFAPRSRG